MHDQCMTLWNSKQNKFQIGEKIVSTEYTTYATDITNNREIPIEHNY